ncbi:MAG: Uma2 family endonuclease [Rhodomicrobium sp.]
MTAEEFAVWAEARPEKHWELFDGEPILQQSQNWGHARHIRKLARLFEDGIAAGRLGLFVGTQGLVVKVGPHTAFEPDVVVFAGPMDDREIIVRRPMIVIEVLSDSTARKDRTVKLDGYCAVPTIEHYLLVDWEERAITHHRREGSGLTKPVIVHDGSLMLDPPGLTVDISRVFQDN